MVKFSIVVVCYNAGDKLIDTLNSVLDQDYSEFEIIVKDALSTDGSIEAMPCDSRVKVISTKDDGIYDAMNEAVKHATGEYILFLNCGDKLYSKDILSKVSYVIERDDDNAQLYFGDTYIRSRDGIVIYPKILSDYTLMTITLCHQSIFWSKAIFEENEYEWKKYHLAADMALYIKLIKEQYVKIKHVGFVVSDYEGRGVSETNKNLKEISVEKKKIYKSFFSKKERDKVNVKKLISLRFLKEWLGTLGVIRPLYEKIAMKVFNRKKQRYKYYRND